MSSYNKEDNSEWIEMNPNQSLFLGLAYLLSLPTEELLEFIAKYKNENPTDSTYSEKKYPDCRD